jgi:hypothetical protein
MAHAAGELDDGQQLDGGEFKRRGNSGRSSQSSHSGRKTLTEARLQAQGATMRTLLLIVICAFTAVAAQAQATAASAAKPKIYISNSDEWQKSGGFKTRTSTGADNSTPDTTHLNEVSAMAAQCSTTEVTTDPSKAAYILLWDTKAIWNAFDEKTNLLIMYTPKGDAVYSVKTDSMGSAAKHVCKYFDSIAAPKPTPKPAPKPAS